MAERKSVMVGGYKRKANTVEPYRRTKPDKKDRR